MDTNNDINDVALFGWYDRDSDFDFHSQLMAIETLLSHQAYHEAQTGNEIGRAGEVASSSTGEANRHAVDTQVDLIHMSIYQDMTHSMAAVGTLAPLIESIFKAAFRFWKYKPRGGGLVKNIMAFVNGDGADEHMPSDLKLTLEALFFYRNITFHHGFEWPSKERRHFQSRLSQWPTDWFGYSTSDGEPWMFYLSPRFITHCVKTTKQIIDGLYDYDLQNPNVSLFQ